MMDVSPQTTNKVLMVRPVRFSFNEETAANNAFQQKSESLEAALQVQQKAVAEFDAYVELLRQNGISVEVLQDTPEPFTPDSIFPNNCFSTHVTQGEDGKIGCSLVVYPMFAHNRQQERTKLLAHSHRREPARSFSTASIALLLLVCRRAPMLMCWPTGLASWATTSSSFIARTKRAWRSITRMS